MANYEYLPLEHVRNIRLLKLKPSKKLPIECEVLEISLNDPGKFDALSYTWGGAPDRHVLCDGRQLQVTKNCEDALRTFRYPERKSSKSVARSEYLWIDAICINQDESCPEKNDQVRMMGEIYSKAHLVLVWLGVGTRNTKRFFKHANRMAVAIDKNEQREARHNDRSQWQALIPFVISKRRIRKKDMLDAALDIAQNPWFSRVWTLQEVARANTPRTYYGNKEMDWEKLVLVLNMAFERLRILGDTMDLGKMELNYQTKFHYLIRMAFRSPAEYGKEVNGDTPEEPLRALINCGATNPKDKIFALEGLFPWTGIELPPADYSLSIGTVYWEATKAFLLSSISLGVLKYVTGLPNPAIDAPSWVPDYTGHLFPPFSDATLPADVRPRTLFQLEGNGRHLRVKGRIFDAVKACPEFQIWHNDNKLLSRDTAVVRRNEETAMAHATETIQALQAWALAARDLNVSATGHTWQDAFLCTLLRMEAIDEDFLAWAKAPAGLTTEVWCASLLATVPIIGNGIESLETVYAMCATKSPIKQRYPSFAKFCKSQMADEEKIYLALKSVLPVVWSAIKTFLPKSHFFTTQNGLMGIGSAGVRTGDKLSIIQGLGAPMAIRSSEEYFELVASVAILSMIDDDKLYYPSPEDHDIVLV